MPGNSNTTFGHIVNGKFMNAKAVQKFVTEGLTRGTSVGVDVQVAQPVQRKADKTVLSNAEIKNLKEAMAKNWGVTLK